MGQAKRRANDKAWTSSPLESVVATPSTRWDALFTLPEFAARCTGH